MDPFTAVALFGGVVNLAFGISSGNKARRAREEQARVARENAARAANRMLSEDLPVMMGEQTVAVAKSGAGMEGSPFAVMMDTARRMTRDAGDVRQRGIQESQYLHQLGRTERRQAIIGGAMGAVSAGVSAAGMQAGANRERGV